MTLPTHATTAPTAPTAAPATTTASGGRDRLNILFICTGNSIRSVLAEAIANQTVGHRFRAYSAGSHPSGRVHPEALALLERHQMRTDGLFSKSWLTFAAPDAPRMDFVLTVCDHAAGEVCPVWPGQPVSAHWGVADPTRRAFNADTLEQAFFETYTVLARRIQLLANLPMDKLDRLALQREVAQIGQVTA